MAHSKYSAARIRAVEREEIVWKWRLRGASLVDCAKQAGICVARAHQLLKARYDRINKECEESAELKRQLAYDELKALRLNLEPAIISGDIGAIDEARKINESIRKLFGLDSPDKHEITGANSGPVMIRVVYDDDTSGD